jgi:hypothetical protein
MNLLGALMDAVGMPTCRDMSERMTDELEGVLAPEARRGARMHLLVCAHCRCFRRQLELTRDTLALVPREPVPPAEKAALMAAFRRRKGDRP